MSCLVSHLVNYRALSHYTQLVRATHTGKYIVISLILPLQTFYSWGKTENIESQLGSTHIHQPHSLNVKHLHLLISITHIIRIRAQIIFTFTKMVYQPHNLDFSLHNLLHLGPWFSLNIPHTNIHIQSIDHIDQITYSIHSITYQPWESSNIT